MSAPGLVDIRAVNGVTQIHVAGFMNHRGAYGDHVVGVFDAIAQVAPGSYGVLYLRDDEDSAGRGNEFQVAVMRRGEIVSVRDEYLSPCVPLIEDE